ncbi:hypothetical protein EV668_0053 [Enterovirga rhinocerotis]|uniref:Uncharacterized protein n=2 Tax=Enterovirga rhinocerotis TaxID=1339210 RepID=A0A4R7CB75_9HYPH|nr:hypothetical protein EV668_0053 [Enterovirga rhinocerotis]
MTWGPFLPGLDPAERKARLRSLRALVKVMSGSRGADVEFAILRAEISGDDADMLGEAEATFGRLGAIDQRRVLASFASLHSPNLKVIHG